MKKLCFVRGILLLVIVLGFVTNSGNVLGSAQDADIPGVAFPKESERGTLKIRLPLNFVKGFPLVCKITAEGVGKLTPMSLFSTHENLEFKFTNVETGTTSIIQSESRQGLAVVQVPGGGITTGDFSENISRENGPTTVSVDISSLRNYSKVANPVSKLPVGRYSVTAMLDNYYKSEAVAIQVSDPKESELNFLSTLLKYMAAKSDVKVENNAENPIRWDEILKRKVPLYKMDEVGLSEDAKKQLSLHKLFSIVTSLNGNVVDLNQQEVQNIVFPDYLTLEKRSFELEVEAGTRQSDQLSADAIKFIESNGDYEWRIRQAKTGKSDLIRYSRRRVDRDKR